METLFTLVMLVIFCVLLYLNGYKDGQEDFLNQQLNEHPNDPTSPQHLPSQPQKPHP